MKVYEAIVISILLYGSKTLTLYASQDKVLNKFHPQCLRKMRKITWRDKVTENEIFSHVILHTPTVTWVKEL